ncbi:thiamine phosphate synthase [Staphylococcus rostri]|uniref:Thiamine phosphate synthase n=1 Tax=Staphylococcus rostri TaxID=522262 RepID=A0A2K3YPL4_9STAP|nr:thiamine phosphate synthase [Staphylococcus rostri]PNZ27540.1 thiamine phosphate synthase [Staphylococcus rostri]
MIIAVTPFEPLTATHIERLLAIESRLSGVILRTPMQTAALADWLQTLLDKGFPKSKVIVHTDIALAERFDIHRLHFREGDITAYDLKAQQPSYVISMSVHQMATIIDAQQHHLDFGVYGHVFPSASKPGRAPRTDEEVQQVLSKKWPLVAIGGIDVDTVSDVPPQFAGIACIRSAFATSTETFASMIQQWQTLKGRE